MKIVAIVKQVPDAASSVAVRDGKLDLSSTAFVIDGMDEYGVEQAVQMRETGVDVGEIVVLTCGPKRSEEAIRSALAIGADRAVHIVTETELDSVASARILATAVQQEAPDLVFIGGKQADWDSAAIGPALAEVLSWPHSDWTSKIEVSGSSLVLTHDTDDGVEVLRLPLPAVVTTQQGLNEPRYPTMPNILRAKRKPIEARTLADFAVAAGVPYERTTALRAYQLQARPRRNLLLEGDIEAQATELVRRLREEAKVL